MMLITSFGASIGGMGTPVGTPPNLIGIGFLKTLAKVDVSFFQWMLIGVPAMVLMFGLIALQFYFAGGRLVRVDASSTAGSRSPRYALVSGNSSMGTIQPASAHATMSESET